MWLARVALGRTFARAVSTLATAPGRTLRVSGTSPSLVVRTNMETYVATLEASAGGAELDTAAWATATPDGDLHVVAVCAPGGDGVTTVSVPASFNVEVHMASTSDVDVQGWLEGTVTVAVPAGSIGVGTVRGLLTELSTGEGDVRVKHVEGNLRVAVGAGSVELGKVMGEDVLVSAAWSVVTCRALYSKRLELSAAGVRASVLGSEAGVLRVSAGASAVDSCEGDLAFELSGGAALDVQASDGLRALRITRACPTAPGVAGGVDAAGCVAVHLPEGFRAHAKLRGASLEIDPRLAPDADAADADDADDADADANAPVATGAARWAGALGVASAVEGRRGVGSQPLRGSQPKQERSSSRHESDGLAPPADGAAAAAAKAPGICRVEVEAPGCAVRVDVQSWMEQRMRAAGAARDSSLKERRPQPYR